MQIRAFAIYDSKTEAYMLPYWELTTGAGIRKFEDALADRNSVFAKHPGDYTLFEIGLYDDNKGKLVDNISHLNLGTALELMPKKLEAV